VRVLLAAVAADQPDLDLTACGPAQSSRQWTLTPPTGRRGLGLTNSWHLVSQQRRAASTRQGVRPNPLSLGIAGDALFT
jgi:hypothetical protein